MKFLKSIALVLCGAFTIGCCLCTAIDAIGLVLSRELSFLAMGVLSALLALGGQSLRKKLAESVESDKYDP